MLSRKLPSLGSQGGWSILHLIVVRDNWANVWFTITLAGQLGCDWPCLTMEHTNLFRQLLHEFTDSDVTPSIYLWTLGTVRIANRLEVGG